MLCVIAAAAYLRSAAAQTRALATSQQQHANPALRYKLQAQLTPLRSLLLVC
jgi:spore coat protein CotF